MMVHVPVKQGQSTHLPFMYMNDIRLHKGHLPSKTISKIPKSLITRILQSADELINDN